MKGFFNSLTLQSQFGSCRTNTIMLKDTAMGKILIVTIVLYGLFVSLYFLITRIKRKKNTINQYSHTQKTGRKSTGIVGKSNFDLNTSKPPATTLTPLGASLPESENQQVNPDIFVPDDNTKSSAKVEMPIKVITPGQFKLTTFAGAN